MKVTFQMDSWDKEIHFSIDDKLFNELIRNNGNAVAINAMEECSELAQSIGKIARSTNGKPAASFAEEVIDVLIFIGVMTEYGQQFAGLDRKHFMASAVEKVNRFNERMDTDAVIFRTQKARDRNVSLSGFDDSEGNIEDLLYKKEILGIKKEDFTLGGYSIMGATDKAPEYLHVLLEYMVANYPTITKIILAEYYASVNSDNPKALHKIMQDKDKMQKHDDKPAKKTKLQHLDEDGVAYRDKHLMKRKKTQKKG